MARFAWNLIINKTAAYRVRHNTMRILLYLTSIFLFSCLQGQMSKEIAVFKTEDFTNINSKNTIKIEKIRVDSILDLNFFKKHFYVPYYFPENLIDKSYKNQTVTVWRDKTAKKDYKTNWTHTLTYDNKSRVTDYSFSGCLICSTIPYTIKLFYNDRNEVVKMEKYYGLEVPIGDSVANRKLSTPPRPVEAFIFHYDNGNIIKLDCFVDEVLSKRISKI
jgi:hypothetical protein